MLERQTSQPSARRDEEAALPDEIPAHRAEAEDDDELAGEELWIGHQARKPFLPGRKEGAVADRDECLRQDPKDEQAKQRRQRGGVAAESAVRDNICRKGPRHRQWPARAGRRHRMLARVRAVTITLGLERHGVPADLWRLRTVRALHARVSGACRRSPATAGLRYDRPRLNRSSTTIGRWCRVTSSQFPCDASASSSCSCS